MLPVISLHCIQSISLIVDVKKKHCIMDSFLEVKDRSTIKWNTSNRINSNHIQSNRSDSNQINSDQDTKMFIPNYSRICTKRVV